MIILWGNMETMEIMEKMERVFRCEDCVMFEDEDAEEPAWCLAKDMYTFVRGTDKACGEFVKRKETEKPMDADMIIWQIN